MTGSTDIKGRTLLQLFGDTVQTWEYAAWVRNYITVKHDIHKGRYDDAFSFHMCTYYIREADSTDLVKVDLKSDHRVERVGDPDDTRMVWFKRANPTLSGEFLYKVAGDLLYFLYSPSLGGEVPPPEVLDAPLTAEITRLYPYYYHGGGPGKKKARETQCSHGYNLTDSCYGCDADFEGRADIV